MVTAATASATSGARGPFLRCDRSADGRRAGGRRGAGKQGEHGKGRALACAPANCHGALLPMNRTSLQGGNRTGSHTPPTPTELHSLLRPPSMRAAPGADLASTRAISARASSRPSSTAAAPGRPGALSRWPCRPSARERDTPTVVTHIRLAMARVATEALDALGSSRLRDAVRWARGSAQCGAAIRAGQSRRAVKLPSGACRQQP